MFLILGIIIATVCAVKASKAGFFTLWATLFNIVISIYLAILLTPTAAEVMTFITDLEYGLAGCMLVIAGVFFAIAHGVCITFFIGNFTVSLPKIINKFGTALLGFLAGFLVWAFVSFLILVSPLSKNSFMEDLNAAQQLKAASVPYISAACDVVNVLSIQKPTKPVSKVINWLADIEEPIPDEQTDTQQTEP